MKKFRIFLLLVFVFNFNIINAQDSLNVGLISVTPINETGNDIWGWVDTATQIEYAITGSATRTTVFSLENPKNPVEIERFVGPNSTWRDMKSYGDYVYSITDAAVAPIVVIDMRAVVNGDSVAYAFVPTYNGITYEDCHNLYVDEYGILYTAGGNMNRGGVVAFDLTIDPINPPLAFALDPVYAHDIYARNKLVYTSDVYEGVFSIYDVSGDDIVRLNDQITSGVFTHNAWLNTKGDILFTSDEIEGGYIDAYDVSDPFNIKFLDKYRTNTNQRTIPHNAHNYKDFVVTSWYTDGVIILDAYVPSRLTKVGEYDTYPEPGFRFKGCWGAYPFLPSGNILATDRQYGLYVLEPEYIRASHINLKFVNALTKEILPLEAITIQSDSIVYDLETNPFGYIELDFVGDKTLIINPGTDNYIHQNIQIDMNAAALNGATIELFPIDGSAETKYIGYDEESGILLNQTHIALVQSEGEFLNIGVADDTLHSVNYTSRNINDVLGYQWGYGGFTDYENSTDLVEIPMNKIDYADHFLFDLGWETISNNESIHIERRKPEALTVKGEHIGPDSLGSDIYGDDFLGMKVDLYDAERSDLDYQEYIEITSPLIFNRDGEDTMGVSFLLYQSVQGLSNHVFISLEKDGNIIENNEAENVLPGEWSLFKTKFVISDSEKSEYRIHIKVLNNLEAENLFYIAFDDVMVEFSKTLVNTQDYKLNTFQLYPNPSHDILNIHTEVEYQSIIYKIISVDGKNIQEGELNNNRINIERIPQGQYMINLIDQRGFIIGSEKFVKK